MFGFESMSIGPLVLVFLLTALVIGWAGTKLAVLAESIAVHTGLGQAVVGAVFVGISTSLSGTLLSFYAAGTGYPDLAISNSIGGIAAQTVFLALADMAYPRINLEHAAASVENLAQGTLLICLLAIPLVALSGPSWTLAHIHPASFFLVAAYIGGLHLVRSIKTEPMWWPKMTRETQREPQEMASSNQLLSTLFFRFGLLAILLGGAGLILAETSVAITQRTGASQTLVGGLFTSVATSLPELITTLVAVRRGSLNLAVGDIIGGNSFDVLFLAGSDLFFTEGSLYHHFQNKHLFLTGMTILMTGVLMLGMLRRERKGLAGIGFESSLVLVLYGLVVLVMFF